MSDGIQLEEVEDNRQASMNEKINSRLIDISASLKDIYDKIDNIEQRLDALETP